MPTDPVRSNLMSRIRSSDTKPELRLRRRLWADGFRYRLNRNTPGGRPDLVFVGPKVAVFVDGCFWHGCPDHYVRPRSNDQFWSRKLAANVARDRQQTLRLEASGWTVCRFWEHEVFQALDDTVATIAHAVESGNSRARRSPRWHVVEVVPCEGEGDYERRIVESLRDARRRKIVEQERSTTKW